MSRSTEPIQVLHVDDDPSFGEMVGIYLAREDDRITVRTAATPTEGSKVLASHDIDCVVSDYDMPERNGIEFLEDVRERYPELPFILYTGKGSEEIASEAISTGVTDYLQKEAGTSQYTVLANRIGNAVEQHRSRKAVRETERKLSEVAERTDDVLFMFSGDWSELLFINSTYEEIWGGSVEKLETDPTAFMEHVHPDDQERARASMEQLTRGEPSQIEYRVVRPDGERRWIRGDTHPVLDEDGNVVRIVGQVRDVTEQKERAIHLETIIDNLPGYVYRHEYAPEYPLRFVKGDAESITGYTATELEDDVVLAEEIIHPDDREDLWTDHIEGIETTGRFDSTYRIITKDGDVRWIRDQGQLIEDPVTGEEVIDGFITDVSEHVRRERELESQQEFINESLGALQDVYYALNEEGELLRWNDRIPELSGYSEEEIDGIDVTAFFVEEHRDQIRESIEEALETGSSSVRADAITAEGESIPYEFRKTRLTVPNRDGIVVVGVGRDVSEQAARERELERIRDFFTEAERLGNLGAWEFDADGSIVWTAGTRRIHGVDEEYDPTLEDALDFFHSEDRATIERAVEAALEDGESYEEELRLITAQGDRRWIRTRGKPVGDDERETVRGFVQDITEQKERERELRDANAQLENAIEAGAIGTWEWHISDDRLVTGREFARTFGVDPEAAGRGVELEQFISKIHEDDRERVEERIQGAVAACSDYETEYRVWNADDELRWVLARGQVVSDADGEPLRFSGVLVDITERKRMEQQLERHNESLEEFAGVVSHDLRTPLSVISGRVELAQDDCDSEHLDRIESAAERMGQIIDDLLWLAREGRKIGSLDRVVIEGVVDDAWSMVADDATEATLQYAGGDELPMVIEADADRLTHLFENLLRNARQHGGTDVTVTVGGLDGGFYVEDDGPGIPEDHRETVFTMGYTTTEDGSGFGLRIVEQIVEAHGWKIRVSEGTDGGARFEITGVEVVG
jgi:PAS domain S-box-containing protein